MKRKANSGMAMAMVVLFIVVMASLGVVMVTLSTSSMRAARIIPTLDGVHYAAEAALFRGLPGIVDELVADYIGPGTAPVVDATNQMGAMAVARLTLSAAFNTAISSAASPTDVSGTVIANILLGDDLFMQAVRNAVGGFVVDTFGVSLPAPHTGVPSDASDFHYFQHVGTDAFGNPIIDASAEGFITPAYVNFQYNGSDLVVGIHSLTATSPQGPQVLPGNLARFTIGITVEPYIITTSHAGGVVLSERILLPFETFYINFDVETQDGNDVVFATRGNATFSCLGYCSDHHIVGFCVASCSHRVSGIFPGGWGGSYSCNPSATCTGTFWGGRHGILYGNGAPPQTVTIPDFTSYASTRRDEIRRNSGHRIGTNQIVLPSAPAYVTVPQVAAAGGIITRTSNGNIYLGNDPNNLTLVITGSPLQEYVRIGAGPPPTLVGDWSGVNIFFENPWGGPIQFGSTSANQPAFRVVNSSSNPRYIYTEQATVINVRGGNTVATGFAMEWVSLHSHTRVYFHSPGVTGLPSQLAVPSGVSSMASLTPGHVSIGAEFTSNNHIEGVISASIWNPDQRPQFNAHGQVSMSVRTQDNAEMGALFYNLNGSTMTVHVENGGSRFDGLFFGHSSSAGGINGHANLHMPSPGNPTRLPTMPLFLRLQQWLNEQAGLGGPGGTVIHPPVFTPGGGGIRVNDVDILR
jgi:hypothetical protein